MVYPNRNNYSETFIRNHLKYLNPAIALSGGWRPYLTEKDKNIVTFFAGEGIRLIVKRLLPKLYPRFYTYFLTKFLRHHKPDSVLAQYGITGACVLDSCQKAGIPLIVHFHGFDASDQKTLQTYQAAYTTLFSYAHAIVAVSEDMRTQLIRLGAEATKVVNISCGINVDFFAGAQPEKAEKIILAVGRLTGKKAPHLTIQAFTVVLEKHPDARLIMIGSGELEQKCKQQIADLNIGDAVQLLGVKGPDEICQWMHKSRMFVQHSMVNPENGDSEGTPNSILEASSAGLPIVSTRHAGIKDAVEHGTTGFLTEEGDWQTMAVYMMQLLDDPQLAGEMGQQGRRKMLDEYDVIKQTQKLHTILCQSHSNK